MTMTVAPIALILEDDPASRTLLSGWVTRVGWTVITATSSAEALTLLKQTRPVVVFVDLLLADGDSGWQFMRSLKAMYSAGDDLPFCVTVSSSHSEELSYRAYEEGFRASLAKPVNRLDLLKILAQAFQSS